jgi:hypothetical protein
MTIVEPSPRPSAVAVVIRAVAIVCCSMIGAAVLISLPGCAGGADPVTGAPAAELEVSLSADRIDLLVIEGEATSASQRVVLSLDYAAGEEPALDASSVPWAALEEADWLDIQPSQGQLAPGDAIELVITASAAELTDDDDSSLADVVISLPAAGNDPLRLRVSLSLVALETCTELPGRVEDDLTLAAGCYLATQPIEVAAARTLTFSPGSVVLFDAGTSLSVAASGTLDAVGSEEEPIRFAGIEATPGHWLGINLSTPGSDAHRLIHCIIEHAGGGASAGDRAGSLSLGESGTRAEVTDTVIQNGGAYGVVAGSGTTLVNFQRNTITGHELSPVYVTADVASGLDESCSYSGNGLDVAYVEAVPLAAASTWRALPVPFRVVGQLEVSAQWTLIPGSTIEFEREAGVTITETGALLAAGSQGKRIRLIGAEPTAGFWRGLFYEGVDGAANRLLYVDLSDAGGYEYTSGVAGNLVVDGTTASARLGLISCDLSNGAGAGVITLGDVIFDDFDSNAISGCLGVPLRTNPDNVGNLRTSNALTGNGADVVIVDSGEITTPQRWRSLDVPYQVEGLVRCRELVSIDAGAELVFAADAGWEVLAGGGLSATGGASAPVVFTAIVPTPGTWRGLYFLDSASPDNRLEHCRIEYGGGYLYPSGRAGNIVLETSSNPSAETWLLVQDCTIAFSATWGIAQQEGTTLFESESAPNIFEANNLGPRSTE